MKKTDVYVVVDTPKKAKKLKNLLDMFKEAIYHETTLGLSTGFDSDGDSQFEFPYLFIDDDKEWCGYYDKPINKTKVSIKELRNILAMEYLKEGDVVVIKSIYNDEWVVEVDYIEGDKAYHKSAINKSSGYKDSKGFLELNFIRYATEEEKALLEPKKELVVGKWYKGNVDIESLIFITEIENAGYYNRIYGYGFKHGQWNDLSHLFSNTDHEKSLVEATPQEVKKALIEEAKRRYKVGYKLSKFEGYYYGNCDFIFHPIFDENCFVILYNGNYCLSSRSKNGFYMRLFENGSWATIIEQDKLSNLKEAFNNGYCVEFYDVKTDTWKRHENPCWNPDLQWRIMVNNGHLVISDVYLLNQIKELKKSIEEIKSNIK